jgi:hypothetical protein
MAVSPNIVNYMVGKGYPSFKKDGDSVFRHMGNPVTFTFTPELEELEHNSNMEGVKVVDLTIVVSKKGTIEIECDEWTAKNMEIALLSESSENTDGSFTGEIFGVTKVSGELKFTATGDQGPQVDYHFLKVDFIPSDAITPLSDEWNTWKASGKAGAVAGSFGTWTLRVASDDPGDEVITA